jgi:hypothetical protein
MSERDIRNLIMLGVAGAAVYYLFFKSSSAQAFPANVTITPENPGLLPQPQPVNFSAGWLTQGVNTGISEFPDEEIYGG